MRLIGSSERQPKPPALKRDRKTQVCDLAAVTCFSTVLAICCRYLQHDIFDDANIIVTGLAVCVSTEAHGLTGNRSIQEHHHGQLRHA